MRLLTTRRKRVSSLWTTSAGSHSRWNMPEPISSRHRASFRQYRELWQGNRAKVISWFPAVTYYPRAVAVTWQTSVAQLTEPARRVAIAVPDRNYHHSLRLRFSAGYENDADEGMLVPIEASVLGAAWQARESRFEIAPFPAGLVLPGEANRLRRKLLWPKLAWQLCIPILDEGGRPRLAVHISGDARLPVDQRVEDAVTGCRPIILRGVTAPGLRQTPRDRFVADSPLEGAGFEPSVPRDSDDGFRSNSPA